MNKNRQEKDNVILDTFNKQQCSQMDYFATKQFILNYVWTFNKGNT